MEGRFPGPSICGQSGSTRICQRYRIARTRNGFEARGASNSEPTRRMSRGCWSEAHGRKCGNGWGQPRDPDFRPWGGFRRSVLPLRLGSRSTRQGHGRFLRRRLTRIAVAVNSRTGSWSGCRERQQCAGKSDALARFSKSRSWGSCSPVETSGSLSFSSRWSDSADGEAIALLVHCEQSGGGASRQQAFSRGVAHLLLDGVAHRPRSKFGMKSLSDQKGEDGRI